MEYIQIRAVKFTWPKLKDETFILRPIIPSDKEKMSYALTEGLVSSNTLFMRFSNSVKSFSDSQLDYFSRIDYVTHNGLGLTLDGQGHKGIGTCRYIVDPLDPLTAEFALMLIDSYQKKGLGSVLFYAITTLAHLNGIKHLKAVVCENNGIIISWLSQCGARKELIDDNVFYMVDLPIPPSFFRDKPLSTLIDNALNAKGLMDNATLFATRLEMEAFNNRMRESDPNDEERSITCSSYGTGSDSRNFKSSIHLLNAMLEESSANSRCNSYDDMDFEF